MNFSRNHASSFRLLSGGRFRFEECSWWMQRPWVEPIRTLTGLFFVCFLAQGTGPRPGAPVNWGSGGTTTLVWNDSSTSLARYGLWATTPPVITRSAPDHVHLGDPLDHRAERADDVLNVLLPRSSPEPPWRRRRCRSFPARLPASRPPPGRSTPRGEDRGGRRFPPGRRAPCRQHLRFILKPTRRPS